MFDTHKLNDIGFKKAKWLETQFVEMVLHLDPHCGASGREWALVKTKLEEACFFAKRAMAMQKENQETAGV